MPAKKRGNKELFEIEHKLFWVVLSMIFLVSVMTLLNMFGPDSLTGQATVQNIAYLKEGATFHFEIRNIKGMQYAEIELLETVKEGQITFDETVSSQFDGAAFSSFLVTAKDASKYGAVTFSLKIKTADLLDVGVNLDEVTLYVNGKSVPTKKTAAKDDYTFYTTKSEKFEEGEYVIGLAAKETTSAEPEIVIGEQKEVSTEPVTDVQAVEEAEAKEPLVGQAIQPSESKQGFFRSIAAFFKNMFS